MTVKSVWFRQVFGLDRFHCTFPSVFFSVLDKKSLKIPKGKSESVKQRTDNTMDKRTNNDI